MIHPHIFREYDLRGIVDEDLSEEVVNLIGKGFGAYLQNLSLKNISVGGDVRLSTEKYRLAITEGLISSGINITDVGIVPTPVQYFSMHRLNLQGGLMITGSHNPPNYNGFKLSLTKAPIYGSEIQKIKSIIENKNFVSGHGSYQKVEMIDDYINHIKQDIKIKNPIKAVLDSGNGAAALVAHRLFKELGVETIDLFDKPDGNFPNHHPDPTVVENIQDLIKNVKRSKAKVGIGYDGDGDRLGVVDENGDILWGDRLMIVFASDVLKKNPGAPIIFDVKCSQALPEMIQKFGGQPFMWKTGHSLIKKKMRELNSPLGGEMSGHIFFADRYFGYDDAIYASARLVELMAKKGEDVSKLVKDIPHYYSTPEIRAETESDEKKFNIAKKAEAYFSSAYDVIKIDGVRIQFGDGWGLIRASNTQPVIVLRFEANSAERLAEIKNIVITKLKEFGKIFL